MSMMKSLINLTTDTIDLDRFKCSADLEELLTGFDGLELMYLGDDTRGIIQKRQVTGVHLNNYHCWLDLWNGDERALLNEFDSLDTIERYYGGTTRDVIIDRVRRDLDMALSYDAEYVVLHISDSSTYESMTRQFLHSDEEVIRASCELINTVFCDDPPVTLLLENLWHPGLTFLDPAMTKLLFEGINHKDTGIMLDTGHLMLMNPELQTQEEAIVYIESLLDLHGSLCEKIRGIHLNKSLTGDIALRYKENPPEMPYNYYERVNKLYEYIFQIETHLPFTGVGICGLIERIGPEYLIYEFMSSGLDEHKKYLAEQKQCLGELSRDV